MLALVNRQKTLKFSFTAIKLTFNGEYDYYVWTMVIVQDNNGVWMYYLMVRTPYQEIVEECNTLSSPPNEKSLRSAVEAFIRIQKKRDARTQEQENLDNDSPH